MVEELEKRLLCQLLQLTDPPARERKLQHIKETLDRRRDNLETAAGLRPQGVSELLEGLVRDFGPGPHKLNILVKPVLKQPFAARHVKGICFADKLPNFVPNEKQIENFRSWMQSDEHIQLHPAAVPAVPTRKCLRMSATLCKSSVACRSR